jgi:hypothetical protein
MSALAIENGTGGSRKGASAVEGATHSPAGMAIIICLGCEADRAVPEFTHGDPGPCPLCDYVGWARIESLARDPLWAAGFRGRLVLDAEFEVPAA